MFGRLYLFPFGVESRAKLEAAVDQIAPRYSGLRGLQELSFFMDEDNGVCGTFTRWESREAAEAATHELAGELTELVERVATDDELQQRQLALPARLTFEMYQPKAMDHGQRATT
jgi:hypothetical protein